MANKKLLNQFSEVIRLVEAEKGTSYLLKMALDSFCDSLSIYKGASVESFYQDFQQVIELIKHSKPRIGIIIYYFCELWDELSKHRGKIKKIEDLNDIVRDYIDLMIKEIDEDRQSLIEQGVSIIEDGDSILVHSHSSIVLKVIKEAYLVRKKKFKIVVAEQQEEKTMDVISFLKNLEIPFYVVPEYMLSHVEDEINKVILSCVTFNDDFNFVSDAGTNSLVAEFFQADVPCYMFIVTKKFAVWKSSIKHHRHKIIQQKNALHPEKVLTYEKIKFSHDRVPLCMMKNVITEEGIFTQDDIIDLYKKRFKEYKKWRERHGISMRDEVID